MVLVEADEDVYERLRTGGIDVVFNIAEGIRGADREAQLPAMWERGCHRRQSRPPLAHKTMTSCRAIIRLAKSNLPVPKPDADDEA